ncbi:ATP-binding protein [Frankia sp. AgPm24]|uniref:sensor histidine kinase n=1 Tax=Frankia sp. AgPm24 TaxID=631128 RepID=UPI00200EE237|nr:ATP-binding protein [Frankia sp. AgPm24]MCK9924851.1 ATP-binding protein [Frankia sp. AgPm24]
MTGLVVSAGPSRMVVVRTEQRLARMVGYARAACASFVLIPLFGWSDLRHASIAVVIAVAALAEAAWFAWRAWHRVGRLSQRLVLADVAFCVALMAVGSRAAWPHERNRIMTELVPFSLVSSAGVGIAVGLGSAGVLLVVALMATWSIAVLPDVTLKLGSDLLGFALWYVVAILIAGELRRLSTATADAQDDAAAASARAAQQELEAESAFQREITHREVHDYLLPIVDHVAGGGALSAALVREARRGSARARRLIMDPRGLEPRVPHDGHTPTPDLPHPSAAVGTATPAGSVPVLDGETSTEAMMSAVVDTFTDEGLALVPFLGVTGEPPEPVREALVAATREALRNVLRHAGPVDEVSLFVEGDAETMLVVVRDRGVGFDQATVRPGGGLAGSYRALERHGGHVTVTARPGRGVKVTMRWPAHADNHPTPSTSTTPSTLTAPDVLIPPPASDGELP